MTAIDELPELLTKAQLAALLQVTVDTVVGWRARPSFSSDLERRALAGMRFGGTVRYSKAALVAYMNADEGEEGAR